MSETHHIEVKTVYAAADAGNASVRIRVLGALTLVVGLAWLYAVWWPVLERVQTPLMIGQLNIMMQAAPQGPSGQRDLEAFNPLLQGPTGDSGARDSATDENGAIDAETESGAPHKMPSPATVPGDGAQDLIFAGAVLTFAALSWLGAPTLVGVWLVMAGASTLGSTRSTRTFGKLLGFVTMVGLAGLTWYVWREYEWYESILPDWVKPAMLSLAAVSGLGIGAMLNRRCAWMLRAGGWVVVISACVTVLALWASVRWGQMPGEGIDWRVYAKVFAAQSGYGWFLLLSMIGAR